MTKIAITGGSGFIGTHAINYCKKHNIDCINIDCKTPNEPESNALWRECDIRDQQKLADILQDYNPTHILHLAAKTGMDITSLDQLTANTVGVENLLSIAKTLPNLKRIVFTSSLLVCKNGYIPQSDTDYCAPNLYGESKVIGEQYFRALDNPPFSWTIVRPTSIWGPWFEHSYKRFFKLIQKGYYFHFTQKEIAKPFCYVGNTVHMMLTLLLSETSEVNNSTYYLADYPSYSIQAWANAIQNAFGAKPIKTLPFWLVKSMAKVGDILKYCGYSDPPMSSFRLKNMQTGGNYPVDRLKSSVGHLPYSMEAGVRETVAWIRETESKRN